MERPQEAEEDLQEVVEGSQEHNEGPYQDDTGEELGGSKRPSQTTVA